MKNKKKKTIKRVVNIICPNCGNPVSRKVYKCPFCKEIIKGETISDLETE